MYIYIYITIMISYYDIYIYIYMYYNIQTIHTYIQINLVARGVRTPPFSQVISLVMIPKRDNNI